MLTARSFLAGLLVVLVMAALVALAANLADGAVAGLFLTAGLTCLLPHRISPERGQWRVTIVEPANPPDDTLWAADWDEPLVRYRFRTPHEGSRARPAAARRNLPKQVRVDRGA